jgi:hypothetical protein
MARRFNPSNAVQQTTMSVPPVQQVSQHTAYPNTGIPKPSQQQANCNKCARPVFIGSNYKGAMKSVKCRGCRFSS